MKDQGQLERWVSLSLRGRNPEAVLPHDTDPKSALSGFSSSRRSRSTAGSSSASTQEVPLIELGFNTGGATDRARLRRPEVPLIELGFNTEVPLIESGFNTEVPLIESGFSTEVPLIESGFSTEVPLIESGFSTEVPLDRRASAPRCR